jgi:type I restriction enzyme, S subunit
MRPELSFRQTSAEQMVRIAASLIFDGLCKAGVKLVPLSSLTEDPQYGFTASAASEPVGPKFVRITDLQDGQIWWETVPYCVCPEPTNYLLKAGDILFARTGATTGKTQLVESDADAVFASYLIRVRPRSNVRGDYLYYFFQSDAYWSQVIEEKEGSAQPNVNGRKLMTILLPSTDAVLQEQIVEFLKAVRKRQDGVETNLPTLPPPLEEKRWIVERIEKLTGRVQAIQGLQSDASRQLAALEMSTASGLFEEASKRFGLAKLSSLLLDAGYGTSVKCTSAEEPGSIPVLRIPNVASGAVSFADLKFGVLSEREREGVLLEVGDVLVVRTNGSLDLVGRCAVVEGLPRATAFASYLIRLRCNHDRVLPQYLQSALNYLRKSRWLAEFARTTAGQYNVSLGRLYKAEIPLPPLDEQERIIGRLRHIKKQLGPGYALRMQLEKETTAVTASILNHAFSGQL